MATSVPTHSRRCPECNGRVEQHATEHVCDDCGLVVTDSPIDHGPDYRVYNSGDRAKIHDKPGNRNHSDRGLGSEMGHDHERDDDEKRKARWHQQAKTTWTDRRRGYATGEIQRIAEALELGDALTTQAKTLFRQYHDQETATGQCLDTLAAACVYTICRVNQRGVAPEEVADHSRGASERDVSRTHTAVCRALGVEVPPPSPEQRLSVVAAACGLTHDERQRAQSMLAEIDDSAKYSGSPSTLAAAIVWTVSDVTQERAAEAAGVTATGARKRWRRIGV